ncbi:MAG: sigma-70 family RNA polymerase sigma factor [Planctomycetota bacterium]
MYAQSTTTHGTLLARIANPADPMAWSEFCRQYERMIRSFAARQGVVGAEADDVVQEVLISLTKAMTSFEYDPAKGKFRSYLKTVVVRAIYRRRQKSPSNVSGLESMADIAAADDESLDAVWEEEWRQQHLRRAMCTVESEFNSSDLKCFQSYVLNGDDAAEVSKRYDVSVGQVYNAKHRILTRLRAVIAAQVEDEG